MNDVRLVALLLVGTVALVATGLGFASTQGEDPFVAPPGFGAGPVVAATPISDQWSGIARDLRPGIDPTSGNPCQRGDSICLDAVIAEMEARLDRLGCGHTAPFAFTYLEMTKGVQRRVSEPDFFADSTTVSHLDGLFAELYFDAFDNWHAARIEDVPGAWQMAFGAAESGRTSATTDLLLGMNAHISRDLAFAVASILEETPDGGGDRRDFDRVNEVIEEVTAPMLEGAADRFDPGLADLDLALEGQDLARFAEELRLSPAESSELIAIWRTQAFDMGQRLADAGNAEERAAAEAEIERNAVAIATVILDADAVLGLGQREPARTRYCERHD